MARVRMVELSNVISGLPDVALFNPQTERCNCHVDIFLCTLGFEPRCNTLPRLLANNGYRYKKAVYFVYSTNVSDNNMNLQELLTNLGRMSEHITSIDADSLEYSIQLRDLLDKSNQANSPNRLSVTLDISVLADRLVMSTLAILLEYDIDLRIIYSEAEVYHPTKSEYECDKDRWRDESSLGLERGVVQVDVSREYPGQFLDILPDAIIVLPTFKPDRTRAIISRIDPALLRYSGDKVTWLLGVPRLQENSWRVDALREINEIPKFAPQIEVSTFNYKHTLEVLEELYKKSSVNYQLTLCPIGSKLQSIGASLFCYMHPDVRVMFAIPQEYNAKQFSDGCLATWKIELGSLRLLRTSLDQVGNLVIED
jgi:hypothetical protein